MAFLRSHLINAFVQRLCYGDTTRTKLSSMEQGSVERLIREALPLLRKKKFRKALSRALTLDSGLECVRNSVGGSTKVLIGKLRNQRIYVQCRGFRSAANNSTGFNRRNTASKTTGFLGAIKHYLGSTETAGQRGARSDQQYDSYRAEVDKLSDVENKLFSKGYVKGLLNSRQADVPQSVTRLKRISRVIVALVIFMVLLNFLSGGNANRMSRKKFSSILFSEPNEVRSEDVSVTFDDVRGMDEAKNEVEEIVSYLSDPDHYTRLGARLPKGVLLVGPPGTGKTLLARAIAGEAQVPFFHTSGSEFDEILVGQGARRVRDLFERAKEKAPCIIFIDEIDSVGAKRVSNGLHPYANQTINQLLSEMDGFERNEGIIVIGATNRAEDLDRALLRPGRFDVRVNISKPDLENRKEIFDLYLGKIIRDKGISAEVLAKSTPGFTGADIENMINQAALKAATEGCSKVLMSHLDDAKDRILMGPARKKGRIPDEETNKLTAYHEAGHTLVALHTKDATPLHKVTIISRGDSLGHTALLPEKDRYQVTRSQLLAQMDVTMGGRAAEELIFGTDCVTTSAGSDLKTATELAISMVKEYGMSEKVGLRDFTVESDGSTSGEVNRDIDEEINKLMNDSYARAKDILINHKKEHKLLAEALLEYETLSADEVRMAIKGKNIAQFRQQQQAAQSKSMRKGKDEPPPSRRPKKILIELGDLE